MKDLRIGLILSGGAGRGSHQAGCLKAIMEHIDLSQISMISSSSIGCWNAYALMTNKIAALEYLWKNSHSKSIFNLYQQIRKEYFVENCIAALVDENDYIAAPLYITQSQIFRPSVQYCKLEGKYKKEWEKHLYVAASFPFLVKMHRSNGKLYCDGGLFDNIPTYPVIYHNDIDLLLILHSDPSFSPDFSLFNKDRVVLDFMQDAETILSYNHFNLKRQSLIRGFEEGYTYAKDIMEKLSKSNDFAGLRLSAQEIFIKELQKRKRLPSMGTLVTQINNLFKNLI